jgi:hypothetical protein
VLRCDEFIARLEDRHLQEGGPWPQDLLIHASCCPRCGEILAIFQSIPRQVTRLPRGLRLRSDQRTTVVLSIHEGIPASRHPLRRLWIALSGIAAAVLLALALPAQLGPGLITGAPAPAVAAVTPAPVVGPSRSASEEVPTHPPRVTPPLAADGQPAVACPDRPSPPADHGVLADAAVPSKPPTAGLAPVPSAHAPSDAVAEVDLDDLVAPPAGNTIPSRRVSRRGPAGPELPRVRVGQGLVLLSDDWGNGAAYGGEFGVQGRLWFDRHLGITLDTGVRYGVAPGFDPLPDSRDRSSTAGHLAGTGSVMLSLRARPATLGMGVGVSAGEWDPGPGACSGLNRDVPERTIACEDWRYVSPDLVASLEFDVSDELSLGVRWTGHEQALELGRGGEVDTGAAWVNRITLDATFRPGSVGGISLAAADASDDAGPTIAHGFAGR